MSDLCIKEGKRVHVKPVKSVFPNKAINKISCCPFLELVYIIETSWGKKKSLPFFKWYNAETPKEKFLPVVKARIREQENEEIFYL